MNELQPKRKQPPRIRSFSYKGSYAYSITICTQNKEPYFNSGKIVVSVLSALKTISSEEQFGLLAYCFMPDHLHFLIAGGEKSELIKLMKHFKQRTSYWFKKTHGKVLWQRGYYDHVLRNDEDLQIVARYIWGNPVRKGLVRSVEEYPFSGPPDNIINGPT